MWKKMQCMYDLMALFLSPDGQERPQPGGDWDGLLEAEADNLDTAIFVVDGVECGLGQV